MISSRNTCESCYGDGRCARCAGSGLEHQRGDEDPRKCPSCAGTGACATCGGSGAWMQPPPEIIDLGISNK